MHGDVCLQGGIVQVSSEQSYQLRRAAPAFTLSSSVPTKNPDII
jgi:hypothetical protein